jgi:TonB family protein
MDILDRDLFDPHPSTPEHTSWTMTLLGRLDQAFGSTIMERAAFALSPDANPPVPDSQSSPLLEALEQGKLDGLFERGEVRPSEVFRQAQHPPPGPSVHLVGSSPIHPVSYAVPNYPPLARLAGIEGPVTFRADIDSNGNLLNLKFVGGHVMLQKAVEASIGNWKFASESSGRTIEVTIEFKTDCRSASH